MNQQHSILLSVILALLATSPVTNAQTQQRSDQQLAQMLKRFPEADTDKDGKLTTEEFQQFRQSRQGNARPAAAAQSQVVPNHVKGNGQLKVRTQTAYALAIFMDLIPEAQLEAAGRELATLVAENGGRMATGFLGTRHILPALTKSGQHAIAGKLMQTQEYPSWGYEVKNGATTIWERWNSYIKDEGASNESMNSFSHYAFGAVGEWMFQNLVGISSLEPGWKTFRIAPKATEGLSWVNGSYDSPHGPIAVSWKKAENGTMNLQVSVPPNTTGHLVLPSESLEEAGTGNEFKKVSVAGDLSTYALRSGSYEFLLPAQ